MSNKYQYRAIPGDPSLWGPVTMDAPTLPPQWKRYRPTETEVRDHYEKWIKYSEHLASLPRVASVPSCEWKDLEIVEEGKHFRFYHYSDEDRINRCDVIPFAEKSPFYCQRDIEDESICKVQCDHCKAYYAPLEGDDLKDAVGEIREETKSSDMVGFIKEYIQKKGVDVVRKEFEEVGKQFQQVAEETKPTDEKEYFSPYPQEVAYTTDKNFLVRLKALIDARITEYGFELGDRKAAFFDSFNNAELYLFGSKFPTPSVAAQTALLGKETAFWVGEINEMIDLCEEFLPKHIATDDKKQVAMYNLYHKLLKLNIQHNR